jgi:nitrogen fixation/metabolism regulation signal transduction histidine kinase
VCLYFWIALAREGAASGAGVAAGLEAVLAPLLLNDLAIMFLVIAAGVAATHRIAGPVYRIETDIDRVLSGEGHARVRLRRGDAFPGLAGKVNELIARLDDARRG